MKEKAWNFLKANAGKHRQQYTPRSTCFADMFAVKKVMGTFGDLNHGDHVQGENQGKLATCDSYPSDANHDVARVQVCVHKVVG